MKKTLGIAFMISVLAFIVLMKTPHWVMAQTTTAGISVTITQPTTGVQPTGYTILRGTATGTETILTTIPATVPVTKYMDTTGTGGTTYFYEVEGTNPAANPPVTPASNEVSALFPLGAMEPRVVTSQYR